MYYVLGKIFITLQRNTEKKISQPASIATKLTMTTKANSNPKDLISFSQIGSCKVLIVQNFDYAKS
jgi:hypothetical protein